MDNGRERPRSNRAQILSAFSAAVGPPIALLGVAVAIAANWDAPVIVRARTWVATKFSGPNDPNEASHTIEETGASSSVVGSTGNDADSGSTVAITGSQAGTVSGVGSESGTVVGTNDTGTVVTTNSRRAAQLADNPRHSA